MKNSQHFTTLDIYLAAFLALSGIAPKLQKTGNRVVFVFPDCTDLYKLMANFSGNCNVAVADYVTLIKTLRGQMISMKNDRG